LTRSSAPRSPAQKRQPGVPKKKVERCDLGKSKTLSAEQIRVVNTLHESFARRLSDSMGTYLRTACQLSLVAAEQLRYREFLGRVPEMSYLASLRMLPIDAGALILMDLSLVFPIIDLALGGPGGEVTEARDTTEIEDQIIETAISLIARDLQNAWAAVVAFDIQFDQRHSLAQAQSLMLSNERILSLNFEIRVLDLRGALNIVLPAVVANALLRKLAAPGSLGERIPSRNSIEKTEHEGERNDEALLQTLTKLQKGETKREATSASPTTPPRPAAPPPVQTAPPEPPAPLETPNIGEILIEKGVRPVDVDAAFRVQQEGDPRHLGEIMVEQGSVKSQQVLEALQSQQITRASVSESSIRVDVGLLDKLMNLVGELVLARNQVLQFSNATEDVGITAPSQRLNLITTELQEGVMKTRMQPIGNIWSKFPRTVRDVAAACGKQIRLEMEGKETELDKTIIEAIKDLLTHIVRNSADHGVETPAKRVAAGKAAEGRLLLRAYHQGGQVIIEISDDGAGLDCEKLRRKAVEKGLIYGCGKFQGQGQQPGGSLHALRPDGDFGRRLLDGNSRAERRNCDSVHDGRQAGVGRARDTHVPAEGFLRNSAALPIAACRPLCSVVRTCTSRFDIRYNFVRLRRKTVSATPPEKHAHS
jgi:flagellar motor switch protein FliM